MEHQLRLTNRLRGRVRAFRRGKLLYEADNLVVSAGLTALASLLGGTTAGQFVSVAGFGSGNTAPVSGDTGLGADPAYYNAIAGVVIGPAGGVAAGSVQFTYALTTTDYAANPLTIQELGLFGNAAAADYPAASGTSHPSWASATGYSLGDLIVDSNGNIERCTVAGTSGGAHPAWPTTLGNTVTDNSVTWTLAALSTAPGPLIAHVVVPAFNYTGAGDFSGTWTISM